MAKTEFKNKQTQVAAQNSRGQQVEQTVIYDDSCLPTPQELSEYKAIDESIIIFLLETGRKEQEHRHKIDLEKIKSINKESRKIFSINWWGMFFAFIVMLSGFAFAAYLIYLDKNIIGTIFGGTSLIVAASIFVGFRPYKNSTKR